MKTLTVAVVLGTLALAPLSAQEKEKLTPAEELLKVTRFEENGQAAAQEAFKPYIEELKKQGLAAEAIEEIESAAAAYFHQLMSDADLKRSVVDLYNEIFTEDELVEMLHFYKTATGRKALTQMPRIFAGAMQLGQKHAEKYAPKFQAEIERILAKYQDGGDEEKENPDKKD